MPTYDYLCDACGHKFELFQSYNDPLQRKCPECKKLKLRRLFGTGAAIMFKGSGFYQTDYRSDAYKKAATAEKGSGETGSTGSDNSDNKGSKGAETSASGSKDESSPTKTSGDSSDKSTGKSKKSNK